MNWKKDVEHRALNIFISAIIKVVSSHDPGITAEDRDSRLYCTCIFTEARLVLVLVFFTSIFLPQVGAARRTYTKGYVPCTSRLQVQRTTEKNST
jgi:hypothetical protein